MKNKDNVQRNSETTTMHKYENRKEPFQKEVAVMRKPFIPKGKYTGALLRGLRSKVRNEDKRRAGQ